MIILSLNFSPYTNSNFSLDADQIIFFCRFDSVRNLLERARAKLSRGGGGFNSERGEDLGRLNSGRGDDLLDSAPGSPVHVPRSKWRERLAVPDQQVSNVIQKWDTQQCHPGHRKASQVIFGHVMQASDNMLEGFASLVMFLNFPV